ncbi:carbohydrate-binding family 9-like protein [Flavobacterium sp. LS1R49]|uniref:Carbohydrate-binding family 9-like protein n=1 Tax=Flavobacterium shii TaxID=2987687 RepID=A0A9X2ZID1_9FLAO|nr:sugar-binding protein [Flavobacterium shii]MCV9929925.1 carbohydrate-binding family 9-like protein [Flavobacterium shii]
MKKYEVNPIAKNQLIVSGKGDSDLWKEAVVLDDFCSPWDSKIPSRIEFKALWDSEQLFFCFTVYDIEIHIEKEDNSIDSINNSDRVELFFRPDKTLNPYYCMEIDTAARIMDFIAYPDKNFNFDWSWPKDDLWVKSSINNASFVVEGAISIASLKKFNLINNNQIETGIFRAKYSKINDTDYQPTWITWVNPVTETPNFHTPSSFGILTLKD